MIPYTSRWGTFLIVKLVIVDISACSALMSWAIGMAWKLPSVGIDTSDKQS